MLLHSFALYTLTFWNLASLYITEHPHAAKIDAAPRGAVIFEMKPVQKHSPLNSPQWADFSLTFLV
jgi:hypothetical protein